MVKILRLVFYASEAEQFLRVMSMEAKSGGQKANYKRKNEMKYDAFISYRHAELDLFMAKKIHKGLETFKVPRAIAKRSGKKNIKRVFRDQEELPIGSDLGDNIENALAESEFLLVICSPRTPESYWVQKEITTFIEKHDRAHVLAVLVEGEPDESFPKQLLEDGDGNAVEPLAADIRGTKKCEINKKLKTEIMRLAAPLLHCSYDDLRQRHRERRIKKITALSAAIAVLALAFGAYSAYNAETIRQNLEDKQRSQSKYLADTSQALLEDGDRRSAALVALEALPSEENNRPYVAEAQYALSEALYCYDTGNMMKMDRALHHDLPVKEFHFNEDGTRLVSIDQGDYVYVWNVEDGKKLAQIPPEVDEDGYVITPVNAAVYGDQILICDYDGMRAVTFDGNEMWRTENVGGIIYCTFDEELKLAACVSNGAVFFFDMTDGHTGYVMTNRMEDSYSAAMAFSQNKDKFAVSHLTRNESDEQGFVSVFDLKTRMVTDISTSSTYIADIAFTVDDCLAVAGTADYAVGDIGQYEGVGYAEKIDTASGFVLWTKEYVYQKVGMNAAGIQIKCRSYQDKETGETHDEVLMSVDDTAYTWDNASGDLINETRVGSGINKFLVSAGSGIGYLAESSGVIDIVDMTTGINYSNAALQTGKSLKDVKIRNGVLVMRTYESPALTIMKYHEGMGMEELESYESYVHEVHYSAEETYYAVGAYKNGSGYSFHFYQSDDNSKIGVWEEEDGKYVKASGFVNDTDYVVVNSDGTIIFYDAATGDTEQMDIGDWFAFGKCDMNEEGSRALLYNASRYCVVDLQKRELLFTQDTGSYMYGAILSEDGEWIYASFGKNGISVVKADTGELFPIDLEGYFVLNNGEVQDAFSISSDGSLLAVSCRDGMLRVLDLEKMETVNEIPFAGRNRRFIRFSGDNAELMLQGDDYYFRVYHLAKGEFSYISTCQYKEIVSMKVSEETKTICLMTTSDMIILNKGDYERMAQMDGGKAYLPKQAKVFVGDSRTLYRFPYMTLEALKGETERQFGDEPLTDLERTQYYVE